MSKQNENMLNEQEIVSLELTKNMEFDELFKNIRCFDNMFGTSTFFKLEYDATDSTLTLQGRESVPVKVWPDSVPYVMSMSSNIVGEPSFLSYVYLNNEVMVFCPELEEPIGTIVIRKSLRHSDIFCLATAETFTIKLPEVNIPSSMYIEDSHRNVVAVAEVTQSTEMIGHLHRYQFKVQDNLSPPARTMLLVSFVVWTKGALPVNADINEHYPKSINQHQPQSITQHQIQYIVEQEPQHDDEQEPQNMDEEQPEYIRQHRSGPSDYCEVFTLIIIIIVIIYIHNT